MNSSNDVVALVLHFRTPTHTLVCLQSLVAENVNCVVLVDNSEDGGQSVNAMRASLAELHESGLRVTIVEPERNLGFAGGVDCGIRHLPADNKAHLLLINSDACLEAGALNAMRRYLSRAHVVMPVVLSRNGSRVQVATAFYDRLVALFSRTPLVSPVKFPSGCCLLFHHDLIGMRLWDRDFFFYCEDIKLGYDMAKRGLTAAECTEATVTHVGSASAQNGSMFYEYHMNRGHWLLARKLADNRLQLVVFVIARCITLPARSLVRCLRGVSLLPLYGLAVATLDVAQGRCRSFTPPAD